MTEDIDDLEKYHIASVAMQKCNKSAPQLCLSRGKIRNMRKFSAELVLLKVCQNSSMFFP